VSTNTTPSLANPYIGPRSFETGERLYGRDREVRDLLHLLIAERVVLLYSPSGAGKSSLIKAALIPALEKKDFVALPSVRVNQELPPGAPSVANRYVYSTLLSLEERLAPEERLGESALAALSLPDYLQQRALPSVRAADRDPVLIFDQFEEVLTADPTNLTAKHAFFEQLGQALADRRLWALFAMREDYLAALDPYLVPIPNRFKDTFRLDLLGAEAARQAMQGPAKAAGVVFSSSAAARLADDLRRTRVQRPDGSSEEVLGPHVEPVQLQVVCLRLWERRFAPGAPRRMPVITPDDITDVGDVDSALAGYYTDRVQAAAAATGVRERAIRDWFDHELITPQGQRSQVMREAGKSAGLDNRAIMALIDAHLVRGDERHGTVWFELAHDRLVAPIQQNNAEWRQATLTAFQRQALLWEEQGRGEGLLLQGEELAEGERWAEAHAAELTEEEREFLDACRKVRAIREQQDRANKRIRQALVGAVVAAVVAIGLAAVAFQKNQVANEALNKAETQEKRAEQEARIARVRQLVARAQAEMEEKPQLSLLLALTATQSLRRDDPPLSVEQAALTTLLSQIGGEPLPGPSVSLPEPVFSPDGKWLAGATGDGLLLRRIDAPEQPSVILDKPSERSNIMFSPDEKWLINSSSEGPIRLWHVDAPQQPPITPRGALQNPSAALISQDGRWLANRSYDGQVQIWSMQTLNDNPRVLSIADQSIIDMSFNPDGLILLSQNGAARLWRFDQPDQSSTDLQIKSTSPLTDSTSLSKQQHYTFSPDGRQLAIVSDNGTVQLWQLTEGPQTAVTLKGNTGVVQYIVFSPDSTRIAILNNNGLLQQWNVQSPEQKIGEYPDSSTSISVIFSSDNHYIATYDFTGIIRVWQLESPKQEPIVLRGHELQIVGLAFSSDNTRLISIDQGGSIRSWSLAQPYPGLLKLPISADSLSFSPDGKWLVTEGEEAILWQLNQANVVKHSLGIPIERGSKFTFSSDNHWLTAYSEYSETAPAHLWNISNQKITLVETIPEARHIVFSPNSPLAIAITNQSNIKIFNLSNDHITSTHLNTQINDAKDIVFSANGEYIVIISKIKNLLQISNTNDFKIIADIPDQILSSGNAINFSSDNKLMCINNVNNSIQLWHINPEEITPIELPEKVESCAFNPKEQMLLTTYNSGKGQLWDTSNSKLVPIGETVQIELIGIPQFSLDGKWLVIAQYAASGGSIDLDTQIGLWTVDRKAQFPLVLYGQRRWKRIYEFSTDGLWMIRDDETDSLQLWRMGAPLQDQYTIINNRTSSYSSQSNGINHATFSPDGKWLAIAQDNATVNLLSLDQEYLSTTACNIVGRNLSLDEWQQYISFSAPYQRICPNRPYDPTVYLNLFKKQQIDQALRNYEIDIRNNPSLDPPAIWLAKQAIILMQEQRLMITIDTNEQSPYQNQAIAAYKRAFQIDPSLLKKHANGLENLCFLGVDLAPEQVIMGTCDYAVQINPADWRAHAFRAKARGKSGDLKGAREELELALQLAAKITNPQNQHPIEVQEQEISRKWLDQLKSGQDPFKVAQEPPQ